jgi:C1A family cysteine protease
VRARKTARYGWKPDLPDSRDYLYAVPRTVLSALPDSVDLSEKCPPVYDQGQIGSCTANAIAAAFEFDLIRQGLADFLPSRLFIYYNERRIEGHVATDSGAQIRDGVKSVHRQGVCTESLWPYDDTPADVEGVFAPTSRARQRPDPACYTAAAKNTVTTYHRAVRDLDQLRGCLADGFPVVFGFSVYTSFESRQVADTGVMPMPRPGEDLLGGHAVLAVGYDDASQHFLVRNSWGKDWGKGGYFTMPYAYLSETSLSSDFWTLRIVT